MPVLPPVARKALIMVVGAVLIAGCSDSANSDDGPTAAEAGTRLAGDVKGMLDQVQDITNVEQPAKVSEDASKDVPCGEDKAKRVFAATLAVPVTGDLDRSLDDQTTRATGGLPMTYKISERSDVDDLTGRQVVMRSDEPPATVTVKLIPQGQATVTYDVRAETDCLRTSS